MKELLQNGVYERILYRTDAGAEAGTLCLFLLALVIAYILGSINSALVISRTIYHSDVREHGSGNAGLTNMLRTFGKKAAALTLVMDLVKTALCILIGGLLAGLQYVGPFSLGFGGYLALLGCVLGHTFPLFYGFRGGKGVLCTAVGLAILAPIVLVILLVVFGILVGFTKYVSLGSTASAALLPVFFNVVFKATFGTGTPIPLHILIPIFAVMLLVIWRHKDNLIRLWHGEEHKLSFHSEKKGGNES